MDYICKSIEEYNSNKKYKILIVKYKLLNLPFL